MGIRNYKKDHKNSLDSTTSTNLFIPPPSSSDPLIFWSSNGKEDTQVNLTSLREGDSNPPKRGNNGLPYTGLAYTGRPELIHQLLPIIKLKFSELSKASITNYLHSFRAWWRILDISEKSASESGHSFDRVRCITQITPLHIHLALENGIVHHNIGNFLNIANLALNELNAPLLRWNSSERSARPRHLPSESNLKTIRTAVKHEWLKTLSRWKQVDLFLSGSYNLESDKEIGDFTEYSLYRLLMRSLNKAFLTSKEIEENLKSVEFSFRSSQLSAKQMRDGFFPNRWDIEAAFHQCLSVTGWNLSTLFSLDATKQFLTTHPRNTAIFLVTTSNTDSEIFDLRGKKERAGGAEQRVFGFWKTTYGAGYILKTILERNAPLRIQLNEELKKEKKLYIKLQRQNASSEEQFACFQKIKKLEEGCLSVWLYQSNTGIEWISPRYLRSGWLDGKQRSYLEQVIYKINLGRPANDKLQYIKASDLRDIYALWVYRTSGGNILSVMRALQHRHVSTTQRYLDNNIINTENDAAYLAFTNHLFDELKKRRLDLAILAHLSRYGTVSPEQEARLNEYRKLQRTRLGIACKDPLNPPKHIAPTFSSDNKRACPTQRCLLCKENAVLLPESIDGICMRIEELLFIKNEIPTESWLFSKFQDELDNSFAALNCFNDAEVLALRKKWESAIHNQAHIIPGFTYSKVC